MTPGFKLGCLFWAVSPHRWRSNPNFPKSPTSPAYRSCIRLLPIFCRPIVYNKTRWRFDCRTKSGETAGGAHPEAARRARAVPRAPGGIGPDAQDVPGRDLDRSPEPVLQEPVSAGAGVRRLALRTV